jgi:hypothetical protein
MMPRDRIKPAALPDRRLCTERKEKVLCLGTNPLLLELRAAVLAKGGYEAYAETVPDGLKQVSDKSYDAIVISTRLAEEYSEVFSSVPALVVLDGLVFPRDLLAATSKKLDEASTRLRRP